MSEFEKPFRPFKVNFTRNRTKHGEIVYTTTVRINGSREFASVQSAVTKEHGRDPDIIADIKTDHHNRLVAELSRVLRNKFNI